MWSRGTRAARSSSPWPEIGRCVRLPHRGPAASGGTCPPGRSTARGTAGSRRRPAVATSEAWPAGAPETGGLSRRCGTPLLNQNRRPSATSAMRMAAQITPLGRSTGSRVGDQAAAQIRRDCAPNPSPWPIAQREREQPGMSRRASDIRVIISACRTELRFGAVLPARGARPGSPSGPPVVPTPTLSDQFRVSPRSGHRLAPG
jgi:hypothetical protein